MTKTRSMSLLVGAALISLSFASCTDWAMTENRIINKEDGLEKTTGTRTAVDTRTNKLTKIYTTTDPSNRWVNEPIRTSEAPEKAK